VHDQYSPAEEWREWASYFEVPEANLYTGLHRESGSAARVLPVEPSGSKRRISSVGARMRRLTAPGINPPVPISRRLAKPNTIHLPLISWTGKIRLSLRSSKVHNMPSQAVPASLEGPPTINDGEWAAVYFGHEARAREPQTGACPFRARFRKVSIPQ
jgi:hypothetical protein